jgi:hypothetical protein
MDEDQHPRTRAHEEAEDRPLRLVGGYDALVQEARAAYAAIETSSWRLADLAEQVVAEYRPEGESIKDCLRRFAADAGMAYATVREYRVCAIRWPAAERHEGVTYSAHYAARYQPELIATLLETHAPEEITVGMAREIVEAADTRVPDPETDPIPALWDIALSAIRQVVSHLQDAQGGWPRIRDAFLQPLDPAREYEEIEHEIGRDLAEARRAAQVAAAATRVPTDLERAMERALVEAERPD